MDEGRQEKGFFIGNVKIGNRLALGPMAGVTDQPFRILCKEQGCGLLYTEMISAKAIFYHSKNTKDLLKTGEGERPIAVQLFGSDPDIVSDMAVRIEEGPYDIIDFNMGCPVPKVVNNKEGSALMKDSQLVERIFTALVKKVKKPVTVKIRKGFSDTLINAVEIAKIVESCGVSAIAVHGRTREQYYSGKADWDIIRQVKEAVRIPVIGNGDIFRPEAAKRMMEETGCDGVMIARGAQGNPWIFKEINHYLETGEILPRPSLDELREIILRHTRMQMEFRGETAGLREMRKHIAWYTSGLPYSASLRNEVNQIGDFSTLERFLRERLEGHDVYLSD
ncbi:tRNA dihydrouridine synthase DusB [Lachnospiraceae bacterium 62-35]